MDTNFISSFLKELSSEGGMTMKTCSNNLGIPMELTKTLLDFLLRENYFNKIDLDLNSCTDSSKCKFCPFAKMCDSSNSSNRFELTSKALELLRNDK